MSAYSHNSSTHQVCDSTVCQSRLAFLERKLAFMEQKGFEDFHSVREAKAEPDRVPVVQSQELLQKLADTERRLQEAQASNAQSTSVIENLRQELGQMQEALRQRRQEAEPNKLESNTAGEELHEKLYSAEAEALVARAEAIKLTGKIQELTNKTTQLQTKNKQVQDELKHYKSMNSPLQTGGKTESRENSRLRGKLQTIQEDLRDALKQVDSTNEHSQQLECDYQCTLLKLQATEKFVPAGLKDNVEMMYLQLLKDSGYSDESTTHRYGLKDTASDVDIEEQFESLSRDYISTPAEDLGQRPVVEATGKIEPASMTQAQLEAEDSDSEGEMDPAAWQALLSSYHDGNKVFFGGLSSESASGTVLPQAIASKTPSSSQLALGAKPSFFSFSTLASDG